MDSLPDRAEHGDGEVGFRLVHDDLFTAQMVRGSIWLNMSSAAGSPVRDRNTAYNRFSGVGFRLAFDRETT